MIACCTASYLPERMRMTDLNTTLCPALRQALELLADPPTNPDASNGYLDLLSTSSVDEAALPKNTGAIQALWASPVGSMLYDNAQALSRRLFAAWQQPHRCSTFHRAGSRWTSAAGPAPSPRRSPAPRARTGWLSGIDISEPMLARAVSAEAGPQIGFLRADAQQLPLRDETVDAVVSIAMLQLIPDPVAALAEMARVLRPGETELAVMVPTAGHAARFWRMLPKIGIYMFGEDELGDVLEARGFVSVRTKNFGSIQWVRGKRG